MSNAEKKQRLKLKEWIPSEEQEQEAIFAWAKLMESKHPELALLHASMNGILTSAQFGAKLKRLGRKAGCPDMMLPVPRPADPFADGRPHFCGLWIELKRRQDGVVSEAQEWWLAELSKHGYQVKIAHGKQEAIQIIEKYLAG